VNLSERYRKEQNVKSVEDVQLNPPQLNALCYPCVDSTG
jgi:hypothetical protein